MIIFSFFEYRQCLSCYFLKTWLSEQGQKIVYEHTDFAVTHCYILF